MLSKDGDDKVDGKAVPVFEAATKQGKGSRTGYIPWAICFCTIPRPKTILSLSPRRTSSLRPMVSPEPKSRRRLHEAPPTHHGINPV